MFAEVGYVFRSVVELLWPAECAACGTTEDVHDGFCRSCGRGLLALAALRSCARCGATLGAGTPEGQDECPACPTVMPRYEGLIRIGPYAGPLRRAVHRLKYLARAPNASALSGLLAQAVAARCPPGGIDLVLPVPMHWLRRLARGRDHSAALAAGVARRLRLPAGDELIRVRNTAPQVRLPASLRAENVRGAFAAADARALEGARVLLVDDVVTTGATANEASRALLAAGAARVTVAAVAKAEPPTAYAAPMGTE